MESVLYLLAIRISKKGFQKLICLSRKPKAVLIADELGLGLNVVHLIISSSIDLYFPQYKLAIEFDEFKHKFTQQKDKKRQDYIISQINCRFIRIQQDENIFTIQNNTFIKKYIIFI